MKFLATILCVLMFTSTQISAYLAGNIATNEVVALEEPKVSYFLLMQKVLLINVM